jgi:signal transduction histidine kinase/CheY-like chemotaxis protein
MTVDETELRRISRVLSEIANTLETSDHRSARIERALALCREIVPARECALLEVQGEASRLFVAPASEEATLTAPLMKLYRLVAGGDDIGRSADPMPSLALPVMGLDEVVGVIRVLPDGVPYDARHLRLLSVVAAQLGAYIAMARLRERDEAQTRELAAAHDFQRLLAGVVGHDLRNPLQVIKTVAAMLLEEAKDERQVKALSRALRNAEHASALITDLVDVTESRVSGTIRVVPEDADFTTIVENVVEDVRAAHPARAIELHARPAMLGGKCDHLRYAQIVTNLVNNALVHGDPARPIEVELHGDDHTVVLVVKNGGSPIPPELLPTIFDPFKQGAPRSRPHSVRGLGLGLYIVDRLARGHGGTVHCESNASGTTFTVRVPRYATADATIAPEHTLVLIVDDDPDVRDVVSGLLQKRGYHTATAANGFEALGLLRAGLRPRLVLLDLHIPLMDGEQFCEACANSPDLADIPIVIISSDTASAVKLAANRTRGLLAKPVPLDQLLATIQNLG